MTTNNPKKTKCPKCGQSIGYKEQSEGRQVKCPHCDSPVRLVQGNTAQEAVIEKVSAQLEEIEDPSTIATVFRSIKDRIFGKRGDKNRPRKPWMIVFLQIFGFLALNYGIFGLFTSKLSTSSLVGDFLEQIKIIGGQTRGAGADSAAQMKSLQSTIISGFYACLGAICFIGSMIAEYTFKIWHHLKTER